MPGKKKAESGANKEERKVRKLTKELKEGEAVMKSIQEQ